MMQSTPETCHGDSNLSNAILSVALPSMLFNFTRNIVFRAPKITKVAATTTVTAATLLAASATSVGTAAAAAAAKFKAKCEATNKGMAGARAAAKVRFLASRVPLLAFLSRAVKGVKNSPLTTAATVGAVAAVTTLSCQNHQGRKEIYRNPTIDLGKQELEPPQAEPAPAEQEGANNKQEIESKQELENKQEIESKQELEPPLAEPAPAEQEGANNESNINENKQKIESLKEQAPLAEPAPAEQEGANTWYQACVAPVVAPVVSLVSYTTAPLKQGGAYLYMPIGFLLRCSTSVLTSCTPEVVKCKTWYQAVIHIATFASFFSSVRLSK